MIYIQHLPWSSMWRTVKAGIIQPGPAGAQKEIVNHELQLNAVVTFAEEIFII